MKKNIKKIAINKKGKFNYTLIENYETGIQLKGTEVKAIRTGKVSFNDSFCTVEKGEVFVNNLYISQYNKAHRENHDPLRKRKLLLHKHEIYKLEKKIKEKGLTIIPVELYFNQKNVAKLLIATAKGKKKYDKREQIKKRDLKREHSNVRISI